jgi:hypothetical protein
MHGSPPSHLFVPRMAGAKQTLASSGFSIHDQTKNTYFKQQRQLHELSVQAAI